jgi:hypothetical protein
VAQAALSLAFWSQAVVWLTERILSEGARGVYAVTRLMTWAVGVTETTVGFVAPWLAVPFFVLGLGVAIRAAYEIVVRERGRMRAGGIRPKGCRQQ